VEIMLRADRPAIDRPGYEAAPHEMGLEDWNAAFQPISTGTTLRLNHSQLSAVPGCVSFSVEIVLRADRPAINRPGYIAAPHEMGLEDWNAAFQLIPTGTTL